MTTTPRPRALPSDDLVDFACKAIRRSLSAFSGLGLDDDVRTRLVVSVVRSEADRLVTLADPYSLAPAANEATKIGAIGNARHSDAVIQRAAWTEVAETFRAASRGSSRVPSGRAHSDDLRAALRAGAADSDLAFALSAILSHSEPLLRCEACGDSKIVEPVEELTPCPSC